jgi:hypothetical protein
MRTVTRNITFAVRKERDDRKPDIVRRNFAHALDRTQLISEKFRMRSSTITDVRKVKPSSSGYDQTAFAWVCRKFNACFHGVKKLGSESEQRWCVVDIHKRQ